MESVGVAFFFHRLECGKWESEKLVGSILAVQANDTHEAIEGWRRLSVDVVSRRRQILVQDRERYGEINVLCARMWVFVSYLLPVVRRALRYLLLYDRAHGATRGAIAFKSRTIALGILASSTFTVNGPVPVCTLPLNPKCQLSTHLSKLNMERDSSTPVHSYLMPMYPLESFNDKLDL